MKILLLALTLTLAGCAAQRTYNHPNKTKADFDRDSYECEQDAWRKASDMGASGNPILARDYYHDCMTRKYGYTVEPKPAK